jgi:dipeptidyl aminopeptidase/acylaminoacyl peptidase
VESPRGGKPTLLALNVADGSRQTVGHDTVASGAADGTVVVRGERLLRVAGGETTVLAEHPGARLWAPLAAPNNGGVAYVVGWRTPSMDLRFLPADGSDSRVLFTWPAGPLRWRWSPDGSRLFVALAGDWDWQLWEVAVDGSAPRLMVREAATIADLAVADDGNRIAIVAQADIDDPMDRTEVFIADRRSSQVQRFNLGGRAAYSVAWRGEDALAVVVADTTYPSLPVDKQLRTLRLSDGSLEPF